MATYLLILGSGFFVYFDTSKNKIGKIPGETGLFNNSAGMWTIGTLLLWIIFFPAYLVKRKELIAKAKDKPQEPSSSKGAWLGIIGIVFVFILLASFDATTLNKVNLFAKGSNVSLVKNGYLEFDKSITVGQAFNHYAYFKNVEWKSFTTENGRNIVQVNSFMDLDKHPTGKQLKEQINSWEVIIQWRINSDNTFEIQYYGLKIIKKNGELKEQKLDDPIGLMNNLREIYNNEVLS